MGKLRIVGLGGTRGYPYPVCKKLPFVAPELCLHCLHNTLKRVSGLQRVKLLL